MSSIFKCKTSEGYRIKVLSELLSNNLKTGCFEISKNGIKLRMFDTPRKTMINLNLDANKFTLYKYKFPREKIYMGINLQHFHKMLKSVKKKDSLQLFITEDNQTELNIRTIPKENIELQHLH